MVMVHAHPNSQACMKIFASDRFSPDYSHAILFGQRQLQVIFWELQRILFTLLYKCSGLIYSQNLL